MSSRINQIICDYTSGDVSVEETNRRLVEEKAGFTFVPGKNCLSEEEIASTHVGNNPADATGYGLLDTGTGTLDKVQVVKGKLQGGAINTVGEDEVPNEHDVVYIGGQIWQVLGDMLGEVASKEAPWWAPLHTFVGAVAWQEELKKYIPEKEMVYDRPKYHGQEVVKGSIRYIYAKDGSCKYQPKSMFEYDKDHGRA